MVELVLAVFEGTAAVFSRHFGFLLGFLAGPAELGHLGDAVGVVVPAQTLGAVVGDNSAFFGRQPLDQFQRTLGIFAVRADSPQAVATLGGNGQLLGSAVLELEGGEADLLSGLFSAVEVADDPAPQSHQVTAVGQLLAVGVKVLGNGFRIEQTFAVQLVVHLQRAIVQAAFVQRIDHIAGGVVHSQEILLLVAIQGHQVPGELHDAVFPVAEAAVSVHFFAVSRFGNRILQRLQEGRQVFQAGQRGLAGLFPSVETNLQAVGGVGDLGPGVVFHGDGVGKAILAFHALIRRKRRDLVESLGEVGVQGRILSHVDVAQIHQQIRLQRGGEMLARIAQADDIAQRTGGHAGRVGIGVHVGADEIQGDIEAILHFLGKPALLLAAEVRHFGEHVQRDGLLVVFRHRGQRQRRQQHAQTQNQRQDFLHVSRTSFIFYLYPLCGNSSLQTDQPLTAPIMMPLTKYRWK